MERQRHWYWTLVWISGPLESTGLFTTHENILRLVDTFERRDGKITQLDIDGFNHAVSYEAEAMKSL